MCVNLFRDEKHLFRQVFEDVSLTRLEYFNLEQVHRVLFQVVLQELLSLLLVIMFVLLCLFLQEVSISYVGFAAVLLTSAVIIVFLVIILNNFLKISEWV